MKATDAWIEDWTGDESLTPLGREPHVVEADGRIWLFGTDGVVLGMIDITDQPLSEMTCPPLPVDRREAVSRVLSWPAEHAEHQLNTTRAALLEWCNVERRTEYAPFAHELPINSFLLRHALSEMPEGSVHVRTFNTTYRASTGKKLPAYGVGVDGDGWRVILMGLQRDVTTDGEPFIVPPAAVQVP